MKFTKSILHKVYILFLGVALVGCGILGDENVEVVKNGTLHIDPSTSIMQAFEGNRFHEDSEWRSFEDIQGRIIVEYKAKLNVQEYEKTLLNEDEYLRAMYGSQIDQAMQEGDSRVQDAYFLLIQFTLHSNKEAFNISHIGLYVDEKEIERLRPAAFGKSLQEIYTNELTFGPNIIIRMYSE